MGDNGDGNKGNDEDKKKKNPPPSAMPVKEKKKNKKGPAVSVKIPQGISSSTTLISL